MKIKSLGNNKTELTLANGTTVFFSYQTPVAANLATGGFIRTNKKWSVTTSKHITQWLGGANAKLVEQSELDALTA